jgi:hypothetical protein
MKEQTMSERRSYDICRHPNETGQDWCLTLIDGDAVERVIYKGSPDPVVQDAAYEDALAHATGWIVSDDA